MLLHLVDQRLNRVLMLIEDLAPVIKLHAVILPKLGINVNALGLLLLLQLLLLSLTFTHNNGLALLYDLIVGIIFVVGCVAGMPVVLSLLLLLLLLMYLSFLMLQGSAWLLLKV